MAGPPLSKGTEFGRGNSKKGSVTCLSPLQPRPFTFFHFTLRWPWLAVVHPLVALALYRQLQLFFGGCADLRHSLFVFFRCISSACEVCSAIFYFCCFRVSVSSARRIAVGLLHFYFFLCLLALLLAFQCRLRCICRTVSLHTVC